MATKNTTAASPDHPVADKNIEGVGSVNDPNGPDATAEQKKPGVNLETAGGVNLSDKEKEDAMKEGAKEAAKESGKETYTYLTDGNLPGAEPNTRFVGSADIMQWEHLLDMEPDRFEKAIAADSENPVPEEKVAGLYALERNGKNRTPYVKALIDRLELKPTDIVPHAGGPGYTHDIRPISDLFKG